MKKLFLTILLVSTSVFATSQHMVTGPAAQEMYQMLQDLAPSGEVTIRSVKLSEEWTATGGFGTRLFSPDANISCTKSVMRNDEGASDFYYCDSYKTPEQIDWDVQMEEGVNIYRN